MKLKRSRLILVGALMLTLTACAGNKQSTIPAQLQTAVETPKESSKEIMLTGTRIESLPDTFSLESIDDVSFSVSFSGKDLKVDGDGAYMLHVNVYRHELFDMIDIGALAVGDIVVVNGNEVVVAQVERNESRVKINGGQTEGGYEFDTDGMGGVYYDAIMDIGARQIPLGEMTVRVNEDFELVDNSDLEHVGVVYKAGDFVKEFMGKDIYFSEYATTATMQSGQLIALVRNYMP